MSATPSIRRVATVAGVLLALLVLPAAPSLAHVTLRADTTEPEAYAVYTVRIPNESETAATTSVEVQLPDGLEASRYEPVPGWDIAIADGVLTLEASDAAAAIAPGEFRDFRFQAQNPAEAGDLVFPAVQTYDDGEVASWTGPEDADQPAPVVTIGAGTAADDEATGVTESTEATVAADDAEPASETTEDGGAGALTWVALVLGALGTVVGGIALFRRA